MSSSLISDNGRMLADNTKRIHATTTIPFVMFVTILLFIGLHALWNSRNAPAVRDNYQHVIDGRRETAEVLFVGDQSWTVRFGEKLDAGGPIIDVTDGVVFRLGTDLLVIEAAP